MRVVVSSAMWSVLPARRGKPGGSRLSGGTRLRWYPPLVVLATASIVVLPAALAAMIVPASDLASTAASAGLAVLLSLAVACVEARLWKGWRGSHDVVLADLTLWGWAQRWWTERRLRDVRNSYEAALEAGGPVRVELLEGLSRLLAARSAYTHGHCRRVARHAERIARAMRLPEAEVARIRTAAAVHDVGKVYTPREILDKPGPLTDEEYAVVQQHASDGADMLRSVHDPQLAAIVRHHHEQLDGSGYPDGLAGEQIPLGARIVAVADVFDAMTSGRTYRRAHSHREGLALIADQAGSQLDERVVAIFLERYSARGSAAPLAFLTAVSARALAPLGLTAGSLSVAGASLGQLAPTLGTAGLLALAPVGGHPQSAVVRHVSPPAPVRSQRSPRAQAASRPRTGGRARATVGTPTHRREEPHQARRAPVALPPTGRRVRTPSVAPPSPAAPHSAGPLTGSSPSTASPSPSTAAGSPPASSSPAPPATAAPPAAAPPAAPSAPTTTTPTEAPTSPASPPVTVQTGSPPTVTISTPVGGVSISVESPSADVGRLLATRPATLLP